MIAQVLMFFLIRFISGDLRYSSLVILSSIESKVLTPIITNTHVKILSEFKIPEGVKEYAFTSPSVWCIADNHTWKTYRRNKLIITLVISLVLTAAAVIALEKLFSKLKKRI
jgi:hypothetical protein